MNGYAAPRRLVPSRLRPAARAVVQVARSLPQGVFGSGRSRHFVPSSDPSTESLVVPMPPSTSRRPQNKPVASPAAHIIPGVDFTPGRNILHTSPLGLVKTRQIVGGVWVVVGVWGWPDQVPQCTVFEADGTSDYQLRLVDAFEWLYGLSKAWHGINGVFVESQWCRKALIARRSSFPGVYVLPSYVPDFDDLFLFAEALIDDRFGQKEHDRGEASEHRPTTVLHVGTDASASARRDGVGIACLSEDGTYRQDVLAHTTDVLLGELAAIDLALRTFTGHDLVIYTDSRLAINIVEKMPESTPSVRRQVGMRIREARAERSITLRWVRGHSGHPLNEGADRLALHARRCFQSGIERKTQVDTASWIAQDALAELMRR